MPESINDKKVFSLLEVTRSIQKTLNERYKSSFWIKAEMNKLNHYSHSGHSYPELVEKKDGKVIAELKAILWKDDFIKINSTFLQVLKEPLKDGITILFSARITFDPAYGLSLRILDIDPWYSLGELEREKLETIDKLKKEQVYHLNKILSLPLLPKRIAIISVETSKGYSDFMKIINGNVWGYSFFHMLFPSVLQGEKAALSIIYQLNRIEKLIHHFDAVATIRGGGGDVGLTCYNNYELSKKIAKYPIPVLTGIGHSTNETVAELVAFKNAITPTELADFLLQQFHNFSVPVQEAENLLIDKSRRILTEQKLKLSNSAKYFRSVTSSMLLKNRHNILSAFKSIGQSAISRLKQDKQTIRQSVKDMERSCRQGFLSGRKGLTSLHSSLVSKTQILLKNKKLGIENMEKQVNIMSPARVLKRGYSITIVNGKALKNTEDIKPGDTIHTILENGTIDSTVTTTNKQQEA